MKKYLNTILIISAVIIVLTGVFYLGRGTAPVVIKYKEAECKLGTAEPQSLSSMITESCQCLEKEIVYVYQGMVDDIDTTSKVKIKNTDEIEIEYEDGTNLKLDGKKYKVKDVLTEVEETTILDYKTLTK